MLLILVEMLAEKIDQDDANHRCRPLPVLLWRQFRLQEPYSSVGAGACFLT